MSSLAAGGKVWKYENKDKKHSKSGQRFALFLVLFAALWTATTWAATTMMAKTYTHEVKVLETTGSGYSDTVISHQDIKWSFLAVGVFIISVLLTVFMVYHLLPQKFYMVAGILTIVAVITMMAVSTFGSMENYKSKPDPFIDWAKSKHGYTSMVKVKDSYKVMYDAVNANGDKVRVKVYDDGDALYTYENVDQLKSVLDEVAKKKIALEEAGK